MPFTPIETGSFPFFAESSSWFSMGTLPLLAVFSSDILTILDGLASSLSESMSLSSSSNSLQLSSSVSELLLAIILEESLYSDALLSLSKLLLADFLQDLYFDLEKIYETYFEVLMF